MAKFDRKRRVTIRAQNATTTSLGLVIQCLRMNTEGYYLALTIRKDNHRSASQSTRYLGKEKDHDNDSWDGGVENTSLRSAIFLAVIHSPRHRLRSGFLNTLCVVRRMIFGFRLPFIFTVAQTERVVLHDRRRLDCRQGLPFTGFAAAGGPSRRPGIAIKVFSVPCTGILERDFASIRF